MENSLRNSSIVLAARRRCKRLGRTKNGRRYDGRFLGLHSTLFRAARDLCANTASLPKTSSADRFRLNVGGATYEIAKTNLDKYPDTLLGSGQREKFFDATRNEFFLDRDPILFKGIVEFYRTGNFHICSTECPEEIFDELSFFRIPVEHVAECCCGNIDLEKIRENAAEKAKEQSHGHLHSMPNYHSTTKERLWEFFTNEKSSPAATAFSYFFGIVVLLNICAIIAETVPAREEKENRTNTAPCDVQTTTKYWRYGSLYSHVFFAIDSFCVGIFSFEYMARLLSAPKRWKFFVQFSNLVDFVGILPYYITIIEKSANFNNDTLDICLTALRSLRVLRVTKLARHSTQFQVLVSSIKGVAAELGGLLFSFLALNIMLSSLTYFVENHPPQEGGTKFVNIPVCFWYCIVTMTTLGYGDMVPGSLPGKIIGSACVLAGLILLALPIPIIERKLKEHKYMRESKKHYVFPEKTSSLPVMSSWPTRPDVSNASSHLSDKPANHRRLVSSTIHLGADTVERNGTRMSRMKLENET